jgi:hypothetical protein
LPAVDLAYQVRAGDEILRTGAIPASDAWTYTIAGTPWTDQQWLAQVLLALGYRAGGWELLAVARAALLGLTLGLFMGLLSAAYLNLAFVALSEKMVVWFGLEQEPSVWLGFVIFAALLWLVATRAAPRDALARPVLSCCGRTCTARSCWATARPRYAWLDDVARGRPSRTSLAVWLVRSPPRFSTVRAGGVGVRRGDRRQPGHTERSPSGQRRRSPCRALFCPRSARCS